MLLVVNVSAFRFSTLIIVGIIISLVIAPLILLAGIAVMRLLSHPLGVRVRGSLAKKLQQGVKKFVCW